KMLDAYTLIDDEDEGKRALDAIFLRVVGWWNVLVKVGGPPIPLTPDSLFPIDSVFELELLAGIAKHFHETIPGEARGGKLNGTTSNGFSPRTAKRTTSRRG